MHKDIEDLRKKAYIAYQGQDGPDAVDRILRKLQVPGRQLNNYELKQVQNYIIKDVFLNRFGVEQAKGYLRMDTSHVPGYHPFDEAPQEKKTKITVNLKVMQQIAVVLTMLLILALIFGFFYTLTFNPITTCKGKTGEDRDICFSQQAETQTDPAFCRQINTSFHRNKCYLKIAVKTLNMSLCNQIPDKPENAEQVKICVTCIAKKLAQPSMCERLGDSVRINFCENQVNAQYSFDICPK
ncbi:MAG: hypothetical protein GF334_05940 [Candidatus Altiarchaeales archaeon]|nr:hypothetical protein [Candidatus Altiarchaeales archaeon]